MIDASCPLEVTAEQFEEIMKCEAVVLREIECPDGSRYAFAYHWGSAEECQNIADTNEIIILLEGLKFICQKSIPVSELIMPTIPS